MLAQLLNKRGVSARALGSSALAGECLDAVSQARAKVVCVVSVPPFGYMHARYLCRRLQAQSPECKVVAAILTEREAEEIKKREPQLPAEELVTSLREALTAVLSLEATKSQETQTAVQA
jgi:hypothetical protein